MRDGRQSQAIVVMSKSPRAVPNSGLDDVKSLFRGFDQPRAAPTGSAAVLVVSLANKPGRSLLWPRHRTPGFLTTCYDTSKEDALEPRTAMGGVGESVLPRELVRTAPDPDPALLEFL
jgi:hypothetical protein